MDSMAVRGFYAYISLNLHIEIAKLIKGIKIGIRCILVRLTTHKINGIICKIRF